LQKRDHPTAEEVFIRAKRQMPDISLATVYNCLEALVRSGLARQLTLDRGAARFCPNMREHCHFYCDSCGKVFDVALPAPANLGLNGGFRVERVDMTVHGRCPECQPDGRAGIPARPGMDAGVQPGKVLLAGMPRIRTKANEAGQATARRVDRNVRAPRRRI
jgi:Fur family peroxide stress response transcriptional regulator